MKKELNINDLTKIAGDVDRTLYGTKTNEHLLKHLRQEINELEDELDDNIETSTKQHFEQLKELGDVLFCVLSLADQNNLDAGHALSLTITKLQERIKFNINE